MRQIFISLLAFGHFGGFAQSGPEDCISSIDGNTGDWGIVNFIKGQSFTLPTNINNIQISLLVCESSNFKANIQALPSGDGNEWQSGFVFGTDSLQPQGIDDLSLCNTSAYGTAFYHEQTLQFPELALQAGLEYVIRVTEGFVLTSATQTESGIGYDHFGATSADLWYIIEGCYDEETVFGCTDELACNYISDAVFVQENGTCQFAMEGFDCDGNCLVDLDNNGICDILEVSGCMDEGAFNYNPDAVVDEVGSCIYDECVFLYGEGAYMSECGWCVGGDSEVDTDSCQLICETPTVVEHIPNGAINFSGIQGQIVEVPEDGALIGFKLLMCNDVSFQVGLNMPGTVNWNDGDELFLSSEYEASNAGDFGCSPNGESYSWHEFELPSPIAVTANDSLVIEILSGSALGGFPGDYLFSDAIYDGQEASNLDLYLELVFCGGSGGCIHEEACNFDVDADFDNGSCDFGDALGVCGGTCSADVDSDGICDSVDDCVGEIDACGICNGPGEIFECGCVGILDGNCDCEGNQLDVLGICGGVCGSDDDGDGICDDVDDCIGVFDALGVCGGTCDFDVDEDGVCDDVDDCIGAFDACGICNGPGEIYECGCSGIPTGACDCNGNQLDALGVCGGDCVADADADGTCDDVDGCVGVLDACAVCNGPGAIYACGCDAIPAGDCDCDGNQLDALDVCGGSCSSDADGDGVCDDVDTCVGSLDACGICNGPGSIYDCGCSDIPAGDCDCDGNHLDALGVCAGDCAIDADQDGICDSEDDCLGSLDACGICNGPGAIYDCGCDAIPAGDCDCNGHQLDALGVCGGSCSSDADGDGVCDDVDTCVGSLDACGICNGPGAIYDCGCDLIPAGDCDCDGNHLDALGVCGGDCAIDADQDGVCDSEDDCVGTLDECGICNGPGAIYACGCDLIPAGACDCDGNQLDALGVCGGDCAIDADQDGVCDSEDDCVGTLDECGICNGPGAIYACGCDTIPAGDCDCVGNQLDALGVCGGDCAIDADQDGVCDSEDDCVGIFDECGICNGPGSIYACGCDAIPVGDCDCDGNQLDALGVCGGTCMSDADGDGVCDDVDTCVGSLDACGICNGPGAIYDCGCDAIPAGDCDCNGNQLDALDVCGGTCMSDADGDGVCDDVDTCVGSLDACGICNGPGAIYDCGCDAIPAGDCDCNGNQLDALGVCGGSCSSDADGDGVCDDVDTCVGILDECGICNGPGAIYDCGCDAIPAGYCDCDGNQLDALGVCGGSCSSDADGDGVCDDVDTCVGSLDACGICNGPGAIYDCGCDAIPVGDCDCDGNQLDALGVCGGDCAIDADQDGVCDSEDDCVGIFDECGICNGPGGIYDCGCENIPSGDCDCDGNQLDALGICGGGCAIDLDQDGICDDVDACVGELDACGICNGPGAIYDCGCDAIPVGDCDCNGNQLDALGVCGGTCMSDADGDGVCDDVDTCVGFLDACGICNGPGAIYACGCDAIPEGDCDCDGNQLDALGVCGGDCAIDADQDGVCDSEDDCVGTLDECGICNGPGAIYACGCDAIPAGDCDCNGNQLDALDVCGGMCMSDADGDGVCDDVDTCVGSLDACGICNGPGAIYDCGCDLIPAGDCDCDGNQLDAMGICGGGCGLDLDQDGICDTEDSCVGELDACGICNGPGAIYDCGCDAIPAGDCDCNGNQYDALGVCGGSCSADADGDGVCDDVDACVGEYDACMICEGDGTSCFGCTYPLAQNFDEAALLDDGSCSFEIEPMCPGDFNGDSFVGIDDILAILALYNTYCDE